MRDRLLELAEADERIVAAAEVGSLALGGGDRFSDIDLTFGVATDVEEVLTDWTVRLERELAAVRLFDLPVGSTVYRVLLLPGRLQVDLSFAPIAEFAKRSPRFRLVFGEATEAPPSPQEPAAELFGWAVHEAVFTRVCVERGRLWQAALMIGEVRTRVFMLACRRHGLDGRFGRGWDELPADEVAGLEETLVRSLERDELLRALGAAVEALLGEREAAPELAAAVEGDLRAAVQEAQGPVDTEPPARESKRRTNPSGTP